MANTISIIIFTHNEEKNIRDCIASAKKLTSKIIVIDMESSDKTTTLAKEEGAEVFSFPNHLYVEPAREFGINKARTDWVFILDADERMTENLIAEINHVIKNKNFSHYKIPRKNVFAQTQWLKYGGWWPDYQTRLINKKFLKKWPQEIHSPPVVEGKFDLLKQPLVHFFHGDIEDMVKKTIIFEDIESDLLFKANRPVDNLIFFRKFLGELYRRLIRNFGFLDGNIGIIESVYQAFSKTITYLYLYEKKGRSL